MHLYKRIFYATCRKGVGQDKVELHDMRAPDRPARLSYKMSQYEFAALHTYGNINTINKVEVETAFLFVFYSNVNKCMQL